jgi:hypothetical protein
MASSVSTAIKGLRNAKAIVLAVTMPTRRPVNEPGPWVTAIASKQDFGEAEFDDALCRSSGLCSSNCEACDLSNASMAEANVLADPLSSGNSNTSTTWLPTDKQTEPARPLVSIESSRTDCKFDSVTG